MRMAERKASCEAKDRLPQQQIVYLAEAFTTHSRPNPKLTSCAVVWYEEGEPSRMAGRQARGVLGTPGANRPARDSFEGFPCRPVSLSGAMA